jgi:hypothetical protein
VDGFHRQRLVLRCKNINPLHEFIISTPKADSRCIKLGFDILQAVS